MVSEFNVKLRRCQAIGCFNEGEPIWTAPMKEVTDNDPQPKWLCVEEHQQDVTRVAPLGGESNWRETQAADSASRDEHLLDLEIVRAEVAAYKMEVDRGRLTV